MVQGTNWWTRHKRWLVLAGGVALLIVGGCAKQHAWMRRPDTAQRDGTLWVRLDESLYGLVDELRRPAAVERLQDSSFVELSPDEVEEWLGGGYEPPSGEVRPFMVRGVA